MNENLLLKKAKQNDAKSLEELIVRYKSLVCQIARSYFLISGGDTDDLIQEGTIGFLKAVSSFDPDKGKSFTAFASLCVKNNIKDALRRSQSIKNKALNIAQSDQTNIEETGEFVPDPLSEYIDREQAECLFDKLKKWLKDEQIKVLKLYLDGYSYNEMAKLLNKTPKFIDNTLNAAKIKIKKYYYKEDDK